MRLVVWRSMMLAETMPVRSPVGRVTGVASLPAGLPG